MKCARAACHNHAIRGGTVCRVHGGSVRAVRQRAAIRDAVHSWGLATPDVDAQVTLLQLISATANFYRQVTADLEAAYDAASSGDEWGGYSPGVAALVGPTFASDGNGGRVETGEAVRGLATLQMQLSEKLARFCKLAIEAGLSERMVRVAERQAQIMAEVMRGALEDAGLADRAVEVLGHAGRRLRLVAG